MSKLPHRGVGPYGPEAKVNVAIYFIQKALNPA